jgi:hypothetical protein
MAKWVYAAESGDLAEFSLKRQERPTGKVGNEQIDDELGDLQGGQVLLPLQNWNRSWLGIVENGTFPLTQILAPPAVA